MQTLGVNLTVASCAPLEAGTRPDRPFCTRLPRTARKPRGLLSPLRAPVGPGKGGEHPARPLQTPGSLQDQTR